MRYSSKDNYKNIIRQQAKIQKRVIIISKRQYDKELHKKLKSLRTNNPQAYWNLIDIDRKKESTMRKVTLEEFHSYFRELSFHILVETKENIDADIGNINGNNDKINQILLLRKFRFMQKN